MKLNDNVTIPRNWKCDKCDHIFKLSIDQLISRIKRDSFYCTNCKATFDTPIKAKANPLLHTDRNLFKQFIPTHVKSNMIDSLSDILVRWQCFKCHGQYECSVVKRHFEGCPYCDNKLMLKGYNTLQETHPYLEKFWDKSNDKPISEYWYKSSKCINWKCPCCEVSFYCSPIEMISRTDLENSNFQTCPNHCDWDTLVFNNDILYNFPKLQEEWSDKNGLPVHLALSHIETKKYWWKCSVCQGEYLCSIPIRKEVIDSCPYCSFKKTAKGYNDLETTHPWLIKEWSTFNKQEMSSVRANSTYNAWWKCPVCTGEYQQVIKEKFYRDNSCPYCRNQKVLKGFNDLATTQQSLMNEWDYVNNLLIASPTEITELSNMSVWWICQENQDHRYKIQVRERMAYRKRNKKACSICKGHRRKQEHFVHLKSF